MGRGGRTGDALALTPAPTYDQSWLDKLAAFERAVLHSRISSCEIPLPYGTPRFVLLTLEYPTKNTAEVHTFDYFELPEDVLTNLVSKIRTPSPHERFVLEYDPNEKSFGLIEPIGSSEGYTPVENNTLAPLEDRIKRLNALAAQRGIDESGYKGYEGYERFVIVTRDRYGKLYLEVLHTMGLVELEGGDLSRASTALDAFYDLDVSDQPIPIRLGLTYTGPGGRVHEVFEPR